MNSSHIGTATQGFIGARSSQEDCAAIVTIGLDGDSRLAIMADGAGGHAAGREAAQIAVRCYLNAARKGRFDDPRNRREALSETLSLANRQIHSHAQTLPKGQDMGTTLIAAIFSSARVDWISVGDSHLYVINRNKIRKLNADHSYAAYLVKTGSYAAGAPELEQYGHVLYSALTGEPPRLVDQPANGYIPLQGDRFLLATDGLDNLDTGSVHAIAARAADHAGTICQNLIAAIKGLNAAHQDNTTVALVSYGDEALLNRQMPHGGAGAQNRTGAARSLVQASQLAARARDDLGKARSKNSYGLFYAMSFFMILSVGLLITSIFENGLG